MTNRERAENLNNEIMQNGILRQGDRNVGLIEQALDEKDIQADKWKSLAGELRESLKELMAACEKDSVENNSMSGFMGARLFDAGDVLAKAREAGL